MKNSKGRSIKESAVSAKWISALHAPDIPDLRFRLFQSKSDYAPMASVITDSSKVDHVDRKITAEDIALLFEKYPTNCDPTTDMIFAEVAGEVVGYARGWWTEVPPSLRLYKHNGFLIPKWRRKGIGTAMLNWMENRLKEIAETHSCANEKYLQVAVSQNQEGTAALLERAGYQVTRYFVLMVRANLDAIPNFPLPEELEIRPVEPEHYPIIWQLDVQTSQDEWEATEPSENAYQEWLNRPHFQPHLWQIAWDKETDTPVGCVQTYINHDENKQFGWNRGYSEGIGVRQEWRRRGVASALIALSLQAQKAAGMSESALVMDSENPSGAGRLFESFGFHTMNRDAIYRKSI
jgi:ribosomal protein S18 acetylase RimI-like enzyme